MTTYIYESSDGGKTIRRREFGKPLSGADQLHQLRQQMLESQLWHQIRIAAKTNPALQDALERAIVIYELTRSHGQA